MKKRNVTLRILNNILYVSSIEEKELSTDFIKPESILMFIYPYVISREPPFDSNKPYLTYSSFFNLNHGIDDKDKTALVYSQNSGKSAFLSTNINKKSIGNIEKYSFITDVINPWMESLEHIGKRRNYYRDIDRHLAALCRHYIKNENSNIDKYRSIEHKNLFVYGVKNDEYDAFYTSDAFIGDKHLNKDINYKYILALMNNIKKLSV